MRTALRREHRKGANDEAATRSKGVRPSHPTPSFGQRFRVLGNQAASAAIQAKLAVGPVDDPYEREADQMADAVARMSVCPGPWVPDSPDDGTGILRQLEREHLADGASVPARGTENGDMVGGAPPVPAITGLQGPSGLVQRENEEEESSSAGPIPLPPIPPLSPLPPMQLRLSPWTAEVMGYASFDEFEIEEAEPPPELRERIARRARHLARVLEGAPTGSQFVIEGHTDATGGEAFNEALGLERAEAVRAILEEAGLPADRLQTRSAGERDLAVESEGPDPRNRRVVVRLRAGTRTTGFDLDLDLTSPQPLGTTTLPSLEDLLPSFELTPEELAESNLERMLREGAPPPVLPSPSFNDALNNAINDAADNIADGLGIENEFVRNQLRGLIRSGVNRGIGAGLDAGMDAMGLEGEAREAVETTIEALREYRHSAPPGGSAGEEAQRFPMDTTPLWRGGQAPVGVTRRVDELRSGTGRLLPGTERRFFETRFGTSFNGVRIHTGPRAQEAAGALDARAFTVGNDVVFGSGQYRPGTRVGRHLLAHELTHVVQQRGTDGRLQRAPIGQPQNMPEKTYIAGQQPQNDGFLQSAIDYHDAWGLGPQVVHSLQEVVNDLAGSNTTLGRIRIVTHASEDQLYMPLFTGGASGIMEDDLRSYAAGEVEGLAHTLSSEFSISQLGTVRTAVLNQVSDAALQGVDVASGSAPTGIVRQFIDEAIRLGALRRMRDEAGPGDKPPYDQRLIPASELLVSRLAAEVQSNTSASAQQVQTLQTEVVQAVQTVAFSVTSGTFNQQPLGTQSEAATSAIQGNFAAQHTAARARFDGTSWIDVRGCQVGKTPSYLEAVGLFFGSGGTRPSVSGPDWYQSFPSLGYQSVAPAQYPRLSGRGDIEAALEYWSPLVGVRDLLDWLRSLYRQMLFVDTMRKLRALQRRQRAGGPSLLGGLQLPEPNLLIPPIGLGGPTPLLLSPPDLSLEEPSLGRSTPGGSPNSLQLPQLPSPMEWVRPAYEQLLEPEAELRMYLNANLVLPVRVGRDVGNIRLYYRHDRAQEARDNWLNSQWASATPGRGALSASAWSDQDVRRVAMVTEDPNDEQSERYFSPDPRYHAHIKTA